MITLDPLDHFELADALLGVTLEAGLVEMSYYEAGAKVSLKADSSPVTAADREAEVLILARLAVVAPDIPVIAEEAVSMGAIPEISERFFLVDPLDGTREFINQRNEFTVNIALIEHGVPVFGIVYAPALSTLYVTSGPDEASAAHIAPSAAKEQSGLSLSNCGLTPICCRKPDMNAITAVASRSHSNEETEAFLAKYNIAERTSAGSSLKFCKLASGDADLYPRLAPTMEWDTAAGHAVLNAAGGSVTQPDGSAFVYGKTAARYLNTSFVAWGAK